MNRIYLLFAGLLLLTCRCDVFAQTELITNNIEGTQVADSSQFDVHDDKFNNSFSSTIDSTYSTDDYVYLEIGENIPVHFAHPFVLTVTLQITDSSITNTVTTFLKTLTIHYDTVPGKPYNYSTFFHFAGGHGFVVKVMNMSYSVYYGGEWSSPNVYAYPNAFRVRGLMKIQRSYNFSCSSSDAGAMTVAVNVDSEYMAVAWDPVAGANEYDLQWTFYDDSSVAAKYFVKHSPNPYNYDTLFSNNATTITLASGPYNIPLNYPPGFIFVRIRPVQLTRLEQRIECPWKYPYASFNNSTVYTATHWQGLNDSLNWQASSSYAEDGIHKGVVNYFDGTLRNRQSVTVSNAEGLAIIGETYYDYNGRPAVKSLPVPGYYGFNNTYEFHRNFNLDSANRKFGWYDFDTLTCGVKPLRMDSSSGASWYYSSVDSDASKLNYQRFVPDAYGVVLGYYAHDYRAISTTGYSNFEAGYNGSGFNSGAPGLYNGNIRNMTVALRGLPKTITGSDTVYNMDPVGYTYNYDQLNQLVGMNTYGWHDWDSVGNSWNSGTALNDYAERISYDGDGNILNYVRHGNPLLGIVTGPTAMDSLTYNYNAHNNQLNHVNDGVPKTNYTVDVDNEVSSNYLQDKIGELTFDSLHHLTITWDFRGKIATIKKDSAHLLITFNYDANENRVMKKDSNMTTGTTETTWYIVDGHGNLMATYLQKDSASVENLWWEEADIYGGKRVGVYYPDSLIYPKGVQIKADSIYTMQLWEGKKQYELTNQVNNVLTTVSDKLLPAVDSVKSTGANSYDTVTYFKPEILSANDYYPFGMSMPGRTFNLTDDSSYQYGFNGQFKDDDIEGKNNSIDYTWRVYDSRLGKFLSLDPLAGYYPGWTPYMFAQNRPIEAMDLNGLQAWDAPNSAKDVMSLSSYRDFVRTEIQILTNPDLSTMRFDCGKFGFYLLAKYYEHMGVELVYYDANGNKVSSNDARFHSFDDFYNYARNWIGVKQIFDNMSYHISESEMMYGDFYINSYSLDHLMVYTPNGNETGDQITVSQGSGEDHGPAADPQENLSFPTTATYDNKSEWGDFFRRWKVLEGLPEFINIEPLNTPTSYIPMPIETPQFQYIHLSAPLKLTLSKGREFGSKIFKAIGNLFKKHDKEKPTLFCPRY